MVCRNDLLRVFLGWGKTFMEKEIRSKQITTIQRYLDMDRYEDARIVILSLLEADPTDSYALYYMAAVMLMNDKSTEARSYIQDAMKYGHNKESAFHFLGLTYEKEKNYMEAEQAYLKALEINPSSVMAHAAYGKLMLITGFEEKAMNLLEEAMRLDPENESVNQFLLEFYFAKSDQNNQIRQIQRMMDISSDEVQKLVNLGYYHVLREDAIQAREYYRQAYLLDPTNTELLHILETLDKETHFLFLPNRLVNKIGGPVFVWICYIVILFTLRFLKLDRILVPISIIYLTYVIYTWVIPLIYKWFVKGRMR